MEPDRPPAGPGHRLYDFKNEPYPPAADPTGKIASGSILAASMEGAENHECREMAAALHRAFGPDRVVWGTKWDRNRTFWEFYFYNNREDAGIIRLRDVCEAVAPFLGGPVPPSNKTDYVLFSIDVSPEIIESGRLAGLHVYTSARSDFFRSFSYFLDERGARLENHYAGYRPRREMGALIHRVKASPHVDFSRVRIDEILVPELIACKAIVVAAKPRCDGIYFSGIGIGPFRRFLDRFGAPESTRAFIGANRSRLDHLRFDVGFDYRMEKGRLKILKAGHYGIL